MLGKEFLIMFNNSFPRDRVWRKKYNISFGSNEHKQTNQIDIYLDSLEDVIYERYIESYKKQKDDSEVYKTTGKWLKEVDGLGEKEFDKLFDSLDITKLNEKTT